MFEKLMYRRVVSFLNSNNTLPLSQFGFRSGLSASDALHQYMNEAYDTIDSSEYLQPVFLDLHKTFDCVDIKILLKKKKQLNRIGFREL